MITNSPANYNSLTLGSKSSNKSTTSSSSTSRDGSLGKEVKSNVTGSSYGFKLPTTDIQSSNHDKKELQTVKEDLLVLKPNVGRDRLISLITTLNSAEINKIGSGIETKFTASHDGREQCKLTIHSAYNSAKESNQLDKLFQYLSAGDGCVEGRMQSIARFMAEKELGVNLDELDHESTKSQETFSNQSTVNIANYWLYPLLPEDITKITVAELKSLFIKNKDDFISFVSDNKEHGKDHSILNEYSARNNIEPSNTNGVFNHLLGSDKFSAFCSILKQNLVLE